MFTHGSLRSTKRISQSLCPPTRLAILDIRWDGKVSPCLPLLYPYQHYLDERNRTSKEYFVGDVRESSLAEIWNTKAFRSLRKRLQAFDFSPCAFCNSCEMANENLEDCFGNVHPTCGGCLWARGLIRNDLFRRQLGMLRDPFGTVRSTAGMLANAIAKRILSGVPNSAQDHINFLKAGSSRSPMEVYKLAGVDMTSTGPIEDAFAVLEEYIDRLGVMTGK
jgi:hypothetical protein